MSWPLKESLAFIEPHLPRPLVSEASWSAIRQTARGLPDVVSTFYLEHPLGPGGDWVDFLACVAATDAAPERLEACCAEQARSAPEGEAAGWLRLHRFAEEWARPGTLLHQQVPFIWLEFDAPEGRPVAAPNLLLCVDPTPLERPPASLPERDERPETHLRVIHRALELALDGPVSSSNRDTLRACFERLPPGGNIVHLSIMSARSPVALKLNVSLPREQLQRYLGGIGWPGDAARLGSVLERFVPDMDPVRIDLTVGDTLSPRVGLEFFRTRDRRRDPARSALLDQCMASGLCTAEQREALRVWPGSKRELYPEQTWPTRVSRWTDVKIVYRDDQPLAAKAYLGVNPHFSLV